MYLKINVETMRVGKPDRHEANETKISGTN